MTNQSDLQFRSKVDLWLAAVLVVSMLLPAILIVRILMRGGPLWLLASLFIPDALVVWLFATTLYTVTMDRLMIRSGPISRTIPLREMRSIRPTRNPLSSPALSLDRLEICYDGGKVMISPLDKAGFLRVIAERANWVEGMR